MKLNPSMEKALHLIPDKLFLRIKFAQRLHRILHLKNPKTYNEKLQWMKLYYRNPMLTRLVDKYEVRDFVKQRIGEAYLIPLLGVWDTVEQVDFEKLPAQFVLKCTHDSGSAIICRDKTHFDIEAAKKKLTSILHTNYYWHAREWPYKNIKPRILAEQYMVDESGYELKDYKFFCFYGKTDYLYIASDRTTAEGTKFDFFDRNFNYLLIQNGHKNAVKKLHCPPSFDEMKRLAEILSQGFPHVRVDFYDINGKVYFGELTFFHCSGLAPFRPEEWDRKFGDLLKLPEKWDEK